MGTWHGTCAVSQLPIAHNDPCRIVFMKKCERFGSTAGNGFSGNDRLWTPLSFPIVGSYDDLGKLENWDPNDWRIPELLTTVLEDLVEVPEKNKRDDPPIIKEGLTFALLQNHIQRREEEVVIGGGSHGLGGQLGYVLIREDIFQGLVATPFHHWSTEGEHGAKRRAEFMLDWFNTLCTAFKEADREISMWAWRATEPSKRDFHEAWRGTAGHGLETYKWMWLRRMTDAARESDEALEAAMVAGKAKAFAMAEFLHFCDHFDNLKKLWIPQAGSGGDGSDLSSHEVLARLMLTAIKDKQLGNEEENALYTNAFFCSFVPPQAYQIGTEERVKFENVKDAMDEPIPGLTDCKGDGDGYGTLFVVDEDPDAHPFTYYVVSEKGAVEVVRHNLPPGGYHGHAMHEIPPSRWPDR